MKIRLTKVTKVFPKEAPQVRDYIVLMMLVAAISAIYMSLCDLTSVSTSRSSARFSPAAILMINNWRRHFDCNILNCIIFISEILSFTCS